MSGGGLAFLNEVSLLHIVDRANDIVITGALNVYATEVEEALMDGSARVTRAEPSFWVARQRQTTNSE